MELTGAELNFMEFWWEWKHAIWFIPPRGRMAITITVHGVKLNQLIPLGGPPCGDQPWYPHSIIRCD